MKKNSFVKKTYRMLLVQLLCILVVLFASLYIAYNSAKESLAVASTNYLNLFCSSLEGKIDSNEMILKELIYDNTQYVLMQSDKENVRYYACIDLKRQMLELMDSSSYCDFLVVSEADYDTFLFASKRTEADSFKKDVKQYVSTKVKMRNAPAQWSIDVIGGKVYLYKMYVWQGRAAGAFVSVDSFMNYEGATETDDMAVILLDKDGTVWACYGDPKIQDRNCIKISSGICGDLFQISLYTKEEGVFDNYNSGMLLLMGVIVITLIFGSILTNTVNKEVLYPMQKFQSNMEKIQQGDYEHRIADEYKNIEFENLKNSFNKMMDEIVGLKISTYEKQLELSNSELRSIRFQIRPHFFLNALTTISSLSMSGKNEEIAKYIESLSKNVRYMFKSGLHTVELDEELRHVENYFEMQELKYPGCVFYFISVEDNLRTWRIPQMLIHTIIENEYKYAVSMDSVLSIFINVTEVENQGERMLCVEIEDDGKGYPEDVVEAFANDSIESTDGSRVGLWGLKRMIELMYEKEGLFSISNIEPHGAKNRFLIPVEPKQEVDGRNSVSPME